jgi:hypothetical protein
MPARCPHCGGLLEAPSDTGGHIDGRGEDAEEAVGSEPVGPVRPRGAERLPSTPPFPRSSGVAGTIGVRGQLLEISLFRLGLY